MTEELIVFGKWRLWSDVARTRAVYAELGSNAEYCGCIDCLIYIDQRAELFDPNVRKLFDRLGIDYTKDAHCYTQGPDRFAGWFHFIARIEAGEPDMEYLEDMSLEIHPADALIQPQFMEFFRSHLLVALGWERGGIHLNQL